MVGLDGLGRRAGGHWEAVWGSGPGGQWPVGFPHSPVWPGSVCVARARASAGCRAQLEGAAEPECRDQGPSCGSAHPSLLTWQPAPELTAQLAQEARGPQPSPRALQPRSSGSGRRGLMGGSVREPACVLGQRWGRAARPPQPPSSTRLWARAGWAVGGCAGCPTAGHPLVWPLLRRGGTVLRPCGDGTRRRPRQVLPLQCPHPAGEAGGARGPTGHSHPCGRRGSSEGDGWLPAPS